MEKRNDIKLSEISQEFSKVASKRNPKSMAILLYHLIKQYPKQYCSTVEDMQNGSICLKNTLLNDFKWDEVSFLNCLTELNILLKYFRKRA